MRLVHVVLCVLLTGREVTYACGRKDIATQTLVSHKTVQASLDVRSLATVCLCCWRARLPGFEITRFKRKQQRLVNFEPSCLLPSRSCFEPSQGRLIESERRACWRKDSKASRSSTCSRTRSLAHPRTATNNLTDRSIDRSTSTQTHKHASKQRAMTHSACTTMRRTTAPRTHHTLLLLLLALVSACALLVRVDSAAVDALQHTQRAMATMMDMPVRAAAMVHCCCVVRTRCTQCE